MQRWGDGLLGHRGRPRPRARVARLAFGEFSAGGWVSDLKAPFLGESTIIGGDPGIASGRSTGRGRHRRLRLGPQQDLHRRHGTPSTGSRAPTRLLSVLIDATSGAGGIAFSLTELRCLLLRSAEVLRLRRWTVGAVLPNMPASEGDRGDRPWVPDSSASRRRRPRSGPGPQPPAVASLALMANQVEWLNAGRALVRRAHR